jgi:hypothetical protein
VDRPLVSLLAELSHSHVPEQRVCNEHDTLDDCVQAQLWGRLAIHGLLCFQRELLLT